MKAVLYLLLITMISGSCRQMIVAEKNMKNAKKMAGVWEVYNAQTNYLRGTIIFYYNLDNEIESNFANYYRTDGTISYFLWWMEKDDYLFLHNTGLSVTLTYKIVYLKKNECKVIKEDENLELLLIRKVKS